MERCVLLALGAAQEAWADAGLDGVYPSERAGVLLGSAIGGLIGIAEQAEVLRSRGRDRVSPFFIPGSIINMIAGLLSIDIGAKGPNLAIVTACTTSTHCIGEAAKSIRYGDADVMVAGGA